MNIQNILLLSAGFMNLIMSIIVFSRGVRHNKINRYFSFLTFFNFLWAISLFVGRTVENSIWYEGGAILAYPAALAIAVSLFYFSIHFPVKIIKIKKIYRYFVIIIGVFISMLAYSNLYVVSYSKDLLETSYTLYFNKYTYLLYAFYFLFLVFWSLYNLIYKIRFIDYFFKRQTIILFITILIAFIFGAYFDLFLCYFGNFNYIWLGPIFTAFLNIYVFYLIFRAKRS